MKTHIADNSSRVSLDAEFQKALRILEVADCLSEDFSEFLERAYTSWKEGGGSYKDPPEEHRMAYYREMSPWLDRAEAAVYLKFKDPKSIDRLRKRGLLPTYNPGDIKCPRFLKEDLDGIMHLSEVKNLRSTGIPPNRFKSTPVHYKREQKSPKWPLNHIQQVTNWVTRSDQSPAKPHK